MASPTPYVRTTSFANAFSANPTQVFPGSALDTELNAIQTSVSQLIADLNLIQASTGVLANGVVTYQSLSPTLQTGGLSPLSPWVSGGTYQINQCVLNNSALYQCAVANTGSVFASDLAAGYWTLLANLAIISGTTSVNANVVAAGPVSGSAATPTFRSHVGADLPNPAAGTLGGVESLAAVTSKWINTISTAGVPAATQPAASDLSNGTSGSGAVVLVTSATLITPTLGVATATSYNGLTITTSTGTLTIANSKTATINNSITFAGTDATTMTFPTSSDTVVGLAATQTLTNKTLTSPTINGATLTTPVLGVATATSVNGLTITTTTGTLTITGSKVLTISNSLTLAGTDGTTMTFPGTSDTVVTLGASQTLTNKTLTSPTMTAPTLGVATATTINGLTITTTTGTLTIANGKTHVVSNSLTLAGTDGTTMTFPSSTDTVVTLGATQTLTNKTLTSPTLTTPTLGVATATSFNGLTITTSSGALTITNAKTLAVTNSLTLSGTDGTTMTFPGTTDTVVGLAASQTLTNKTITSPTVSSPTVSGTATYSGTVNVTGTFEISGSAITFPSGVSTLAGLGTAQTFTAAQTMTNSLLRLLGSSTGYTTFTSANASGTNYTLTFPALTSTVVTQGDTNTVALTTIAQQSANTLLGNFTTGTGNVTATTVANLVSKPSPATTDLIVIADIATGQIKSTPVSAVAAAGSVGSIAGNTGAFTLTNGITNNNNAIELALNNATLCATVNGPNAVTSTTSGGNNMMGLGAAFHLTPVYSGRVHLTIDGSWYNSSTQATTVRVCYGSGAAPGNATTQAGTVVGNSTANNSVTASELTAQSFSRTVIITGLSIGTAYWFDLSVYSAGAQTATVLDLTGTAFEF